MKIFTQIKDSINNKDFYQSIPANVGLKQAVKYLIKVSLLLSIVGIIFAAFYMPKVITSVKEAASSFVASYPDDLIVSLKSGNISINKPEPFIVPFDEKFKKGLLESEQKNRRSEEEKSEVQQYKDIENLVIIDTTKPFTIEEFKNMKTMIWVTKSDIVVLKGSDGEIQIMPLTKAKDIKITKSWVDQKQALFYKFLPTLIVFAIIAIYIMFFIGTLFSSLFFALFYGLVIYGMSQISKKELTYKQSYIMSIYAMTLILVLNAFSLYIKIPLQGVLNLLILVAIVYLNYFKESKGSSENTPENTTEIAQAPVNTENTEITQ